jgi:multidrug transporter EmrE-like cation transporter
MTYLSGRLPGAYLYPFVNGSMIVLLTLASAVVFKEKLTKGGTIGILTGILAIVAVNL